MKLTDYEIPNSIEFTKLSEFPDGEEIFVVGAGIITGGKYGDSPYFLTDNNLKVTLPHRYTSYISDLLNDEEACDDLTGGMTIIKSSKKCSNGTMTSTFEYKLD